jgi:RNA polymerase sigma-70 factor, ECF subfamily
MNKVGNPSLEQAATVPGTEWIRWARSAAFVPEHLSALFSVTTDELALFFQAVFYRPLERWLDEARLWEAARLACHPEPLPAIADRVELSVRDLTAAFEEYHRCRPDVFRQIWRTRAGHRFGRGSARGKGRPTAPSIKMDSWEILQPWTQAFQSLSCCRGYRRMLAAGNPIHPDLDLLACCLHEEILRGEKEARDLFERLFLDRLKGPLSSQFPGASQSQTAAALTSVLAAYFDDPGRWDRHWRRLPKALVESAATILRGVAASAHRSAGLEEMWIKEARRGDPQAFAACVQAIQPMLMRKALSLARDHSGAEDLVQETLISAWKGIGGFKGQSAFTTWVYGILLRHSSSAVRKKRREPPILPLEHLDFAADQSCFWDRLPDPFVADFDQPEFWRAVRSQLSPAEFEAIHLRYREGLKLRDIAEKAAIPLGTVKTLLFTARKKLKRAKDLERF